MTVIPISVTVLLTSFFITNANSRGMNHCLSVPLQLKYLARLCNVWHALHLSHRTNVKMRDNFSPFRLSAYADNIMVAVMDDSDAQK